MSKIYKAKSKNGEDLLLVSKEYVDSRIGALKAALLQHERNIDNPHTEDSDTSVKSISNLDKEEIVDVEMETTFPEITTEMIKQDSQHRMLTDTQIAAFRNKASVYEIQDAVQSAKSELKSNFNELYTRLLNMPDAVSRLREVAVLCRENDTVKGLLETLNDKVSSEDMDEHINSNLHMNNVDRKALNVVLDLINDGITEKLQHIGEYAKMADYASDATLLEHKTLAEIQELNLEDKIYGVADSSIDRSYNSVHYLFHEAGCDLFKKLNEDGYLLNGGLIAFKTGKYQSSNMQFHRGRNDRSLTIQGSGYSTEFITNRLDTCNTTYRDLSVIGIDPSNTYDQNIVSVGAKTVFENVEFKDMKIIIEDGAELARFKNCNFNNCKFSFSTGYSSFIISECFFHKCKIPKMISPTALIVNNVEV